VLSRTWGEEEGSVVIHEEEEGGGGRRRGDGRRYKTPTHLDPLQ